ncbi:predicted hydrolase [Longilinea arvoryzae]|uniref:Predicted hydrolase n=1 Tax=Longilinea arvoryzae TaxID=360412 RepID=A0A0S7BF43_9CHLR|nr:alpha/beta hydrolase [Longilinea arvoryzae]GAP14205.1 predicted hydrolase [Longilinea arvoryzae]
MELEPVDLYFEETGNGFPVFLLHGYPLNHTIWKSVVARLKDHARVIMPDLRGHGQSPVTDGEYSMRLQAEDIHHLLERLGIQKAILVGHSMGGYVCLSFARAYPQCLSGLALVASQAEADSTEKRQARYISIEEVGRKGVKAVAKKMLPRLTQRKDLESELIEMMLKTPKKGIIGALKGMAERPNALEWLAEITVPAVVIAGQEDLNIPLERERTMAQMLTRGWLVEVPGVAHLPMMEEPQTVSDALIQLVNLASA